MIITQPKEMIAAFVAQQQGQNLPWGNFSAVGWVRRGELVAGVVFNHFSIANICLHIGALRKHWPSPEFIYAIFDYPFNQLKLRRVTGLVAKKNGPARRFAEHLGGRLEGCMRHALPHDDLLIYGMLQRECKWLKEPFVSRLERRIQRRALPLAA